MRYIVREERTRAQIVEAESAEEAARIAETHPEQYDSEDVAIEAELEVAVPVERRSSHHGI